MSSPLDWIKDAASRAQWRSTLKEKSGDELAVTYAVLLSCRHGKWTKLVDEHTPVVVDEGKRRGIDVEKIAWAYADDFRARHPDGKFDAADMRAYLKRRT